MKMANIPSFTFVARACFLAFCVLLTSALEAAAQDNIKGYDLKDYTTFPGVGTYKFHARGADWNEALRTCTSEGTKMLLVNSNLEAEVIKSLCRNNPKSDGAAKNNRVWVGVKEKGTNGKFFANDGQQLRQLGYLAWAKSPQQPNAPGGYDCVTFHADGSLYDKECHIKYPFVCEV